MTHLCVCVFPVSISRFKKKRKKNKQKNALSRHVLLSQTATRRQGSLPHGLRASSLPVRVYTFVWPRLRARTTRE